MRHCQRDFKRVSPQEYETWRELYLRLHDEREERLRKLTQNISSAHANKPKGIYTYLLHGFYLRKWCSCALILLCTHGYGPLEVFRATKIFFDVQPYVTKKLHILFTE